MSVAKPENVPPISRTRFVERACKVESVPGYVWSTGLMVGGRLPLPTGTVRQIVSNVLCFINSTLQTTSKVNRPGVIVSRSDFGGHCLLL